MLAALGWFAVRRRRWVVAGTLAAVVVAGALGGGVFGRLSGGGFSDPDAESSRARDQLERVFGAGDPNLVLLVTAEQGSVDDPAVTAEGTALREELVSEPSVQQASSYWMVGWALPLRSDDRRQALVLARIAGNQDQVDQAVQELLPRYTRTTAR
jgi:putative drug exporter of the RND superfamily